MVKRISNKRNNIKMTDTITGVVAGIKSFPSTTGGKAMYSVTIDGKFYGFGNDVPRFETGDEVSFGVTQKGKYFNAVTSSVKVLGKATADSVAKITTAAANDPRQKTIARQSTLNSALAFVTLAASLESIPGLTKTMKPEERFQLLEALVMEKVADYYLTSTGTAYEPVAEPEVTSAETVPLARAAGWG